jgi:hypothetical protein
MTSIASLAFVANFWRQPVALFHDDEPSISFNTTPSCSAWGNIGIDEEFAAADTLLRSGSVTR